MKILTLRTWLIALLLILGVGSVWADEVTLDFTQISGFSDWTTSYTKHEVEYDGFGTVTFASANKSNTTITDMPVTKGGEVTFVAVDGKLIKSLTFTCNQWGSYAQTITLHTSKNGGKSYTQTNVTSETFSLSASDLTDVNAVKFTFSSTSNQVGIQSLTLQMENEVRYSVYVAGNITNGSVSVNPTSAKAGTKVTLTATPNEGYVLASCDVINTLTHEPITVTDGKFTMPAADVNVSATFHAGKKGTINFGANGVRINSASVTGQDNIKNSWTITTVGTTSFMITNASYSQVGSAEKQATRITFTTTLPKNVNIIAFSAKFGGFTGTTGTVNLKVGETVVGSGSLNGTSNVTVTSTTTAIGKVLTVTVTGIAKGVKCYNISYTYEELPDFTSQTQSFVAQDAGGTYYATFSNANDVFMTESAKVYAVTVNDSKLAMNEFEQSEVEIEGNSVKGYWIPANTGALLESTGNSVTYYTVANANISPIEAANLLRPASTPMETDGSYLFYKLAYGNVNDRSTLGFWWGADGGAHYTAKAGAYLAVPNAVGASLISGFSFGDDETGINAVEQNRDVKADGKYLKDGRIIIVRGGTEYDVMGMKK